MWFLTVLYVQKIDKRFWIKIGKNSWIIALTGDFNTKTTALRWPPRFFLTLRDLRTLKNGGSWFRKKTPPDPPGDGLYSIYATTAVSFFGSHFRYLAIASASWNFVYGLILALWKNFVEDRMSKFYLEKKLQTINF